MDLYRPRFIIYSIRRTGSVSRSLSIRLLLLEELCFNWMVWQRISKWFTGCSAAAFKARSIWKQTDVVYFKMDWKKVCIKKAWGEWMANWRIVLVFFFFVFVYSIWGCFVFWVSQWFKICTFLCHCCWVFFKMCLGILLRLCQVSPQAWLRHVNRVVNDWHGDTMWEVSRVTEAYYMLHERNWGGGKEWLMAMVLFKDT